MNKPEFSVVKENDRPSAKDHNKKSKLLAAVCNSLHIQGFTDSTGFHTRRTPESSKFRATIFKVYAEGTGDGIYDCHLQVLDATEWDDEAGTNKLIDLEGTPVDVEVLNLAEFDPEPTYVSHLKANDLILAWKFTDDEGNIRWIGVPFRQANADRPRIAYCKTDAGAGTTIVCYLDTDGTGTEITVNCSIMNGTDLNAAVPRLEDGGVLLVTKVGDTWWAIHPFNGSEDCECYEAP